jgi:DOPA 4,5-dioxygenase
MSERVIKGYHAHIYYDPKSTRDAAARVRAGLAAGGFNVQLGSWHDEPVGPHLDAMYQAIFAPEEFGKIVPWLMLHREGLSVLVHPSTGTATAIISNAALARRKVEVERKVLRRGCRNRCSDEKFTAPRILMVGHLKNVSPFEIRCNLQSRPVSGAGDFHPSIAGPSFGSFMMRSWLRRKRSEENPGSLESVKTGAADCGET